MPSRTPAGLLAQVGEPGRPHREVAEALGISEDAVKMSLLRLRRLAAAGARIFYGHDPGFWEGVPQAPLSIP